MLLGRRYFRKTLERMSGNCYIASIQLDIHSVLGLDIRSLLIMPVQRIPRYRLFIETLIKITPGHFLDKLLLGKALVAMKVEVFSYVAWPLPHSMLSNRTQPRSSTTHPASRKGFSGFVDLLDMCRALALTPLIHIISRRKSCRIRSRHASLPRQPAPLSSASTLHSSFAPCHFPCIINDYLLVATVHVFLQIPNLGKEPS